MTIKELIQEIERAFKNISLEDGIGLWEAQGLDDYLSAEECQKLRGQDEKNDWHKIPLIDLYTCSSSLSFFDAKGLRFHLPQLLLLDLAVFKAEETRLHKEGRILHAIAPAVQAILTHDLETDHSKKRFSLLNAVQIQCVIHFLEYKQQELVEHYQNFYFKNYGTDPAAVYSDKTYLELEKARQIWQSKPG